MRVVTYGYVKGPSMAAMIGGELEIQDLVMEERQP